jgi:UDPglucose--hexose-1-phosphate uridylyltransferase
MSMSDEPELRRDPVTGRWVLIAPERARRPIALSDAGPQSRTAGERRPCPFCPGEEHDTPNEVYAIRDPGSSPNGFGWRLRVVPNKFPAVRTEEEPNPLTPFPEKEGGVRARSSALSPSPLGGGVGEGSAFSPPSFPGKGVGGLGSSLFNSAPAIGFAEVVIDCPEHIDNPTLLSHEQFRDVFRAYRERMTALAADPRLAHVAVFKNVGAEAGASLGHTHSQIIATPVVPALIQSELTGAEAYFARTGRCVFCDIANEELADGSRVVARSEHFVVVTAFAPRFAYEMWVLPVQHESRYESITDDLATELAVLLTRVLRALDTVQHSPAYNWFLHTTPLHAGSPPYYHWHLEILPRTARPAGLEWGFGCHITTASPERAALELRSALGPLSRTSEQ